MNVSKSPIQQCPICRAQQPLEAIRCDLCGAALTGIPISGAPAGHSKRKERPSLGGPIMADWDEGETDLYEGTLPRLPLQGLLVVVVALAVLGGAAFFVATQVGGARAAPTRPTLTATLRVASGPTDVPTAGSPPPAQNTLPPTNTKFAIMPTLALATVTPAPPTPTITPTQGPCMQTARKGDTIYGMAARCGHKHLSIVEVVLELNNMKDANQLQIGQTLLIPWPTPTGAAQSDGLTPTPGGATNLEPTLPAGVTWYTVKKGDTAVGILFAYHTDMKTLRDLNPEIQFQQCDFGQPAGGSTCTLSPMLGQGQRIRVPAPTPTPSLSPTLTGSETATPSSTPTYNAPFSQSPGDNMLFESSELPTLRWVASGQLASNEVYLVTVRNTTTGTTYTATTREMSFQLLAEWQPTDGKRHVFEWSVAVARTGESGTPTPTAFTTETRTFTWQGR